ncbi:MAG: serine protease [Eubacterium sp.]|nr:serine protease [Eubacterium sp.]
MSREVRIGEFGDRGQENIVVKIPQRNRKKHTVPSTQQAQPAGQYAVAASPQPQRSEKSFEELAALASSIVLILVHDADGAVISTGSGIMASNAGYILTNDHVARGGYSYSVRIENDGQVYHTDELIKYNTLLDLALLRINRRLDPIPIYQGQKKLVRGQAVAAIGSPLGLFNSISDGIISGFRTIDGVDMIQFTAPISHGSSGGAVLNMYGEVIGISTAGFDRGQNINLAIGYESINLFLQGFR